MRRRMLMQNGGAHAQPPNQKKWKSIELVQNDNSESFAYGQFIVVLTDLNNQKIVVISPSIPNSTTFKLSYFGLSSNGLQEGTITNGTQLVVLYSYDEQTFTTEQIYNLQKAMASKNAGNEIWTLTEQYYMDVTLNAKSDFDVDSYATVEEAKEAAQELGINITWPII